MGKSEFGCGANKTELGKTEFSTGMGKKNPAQDFDPLHLANQYLENYLEAVPMAMVISLAAEISGANRRVLNCALGVLFLLKVGYFELELRLPSSVRLGRVIGYFGDESWLAGMAGYCAYLANDSWWY